MFSSFLTVQASLSHFFFPHPCSFFWKNQEKQSTLSFTYPWFIGSFVIQKSVLTSKGLCSAYPLTEDWECIVFVFLWRAHPILLQGFAEPGFSGIAVRQGLVGGFVLTLNTRNTHFMVPSNLVSSSEEIMVKLLKWIEMWVQVKIAEHCCFCSRPSVFLVVTGAIYEKWRYNINLNSF